MTDEEAYVAIAEELAELPEELFDRLAICAYAFDQGLYPQ